MTVENAEHAGAILYDNVRPGADIVLTADQQAEYEKRALALTKLLGAEKLIAKYKIELMFGKARGPVDRPTPGMISFWHSGSKFHGGGDEKIYLCPGERLKMSNCHAVLEASYNSAMGVVCPTCGQTWRHEQVIGELLFNLPMRKWAEVMHRYFRLFEYNSDLYLKFAPKDIRSVTKAHLEKQSWAGVQKLEKTRAERAKALYPLRNIVTDLHAGADLEKRIYAFLVA